MSCLNRFNIGLLADCVAQYGMLHVPCAELCEEAASLGLFAEVSAAQHEIRKRRAEAERRVHQCAVPAGLQTALAAAVELGAPRRRIVLYVACSRVDMLSCSQQCVEFCICAPWQGLHGVHSWQKQATHAQLCRTLRQEVPSSW